jgi:dTDP-4-amino-4,6-dideoxygalactose transaminase
MKSNNKIEQINVTQTFFPPLEEYQLKFERVWKNKWLTYRGELLQDLVEKLKTYLSVSNIIIMNNSTIPFQIALKLLGND